jgi:hypothetical protein
VRRAGKLDLTFGICVAPLSLGGLRGKKSTPSDWWGGIGVVSMVGEREWHGAGATRSTWAPSRGGNKEMICSFNW